MTNLDKINAEIVAELAIITHAYRLVDQTLGSKDTVKLARGVILSDLAETIHAATGRLDILNTLKRRAEIVNAA